MHNLEDHIAQLYANDLEINLKASAAVKQDPAFLPAPEPAKFYEFTGALYGTLANSKQ